MKAAMLSQEAKKNFQADPSRFIEQEIKELARTSPLNIMPSAEGGVIFDEPIVRFADGVDPIFTEYKKVVAPTHLTPTEALAQAYDKAFGDMPARLSVISWILPITERTRRANRRAKHAPSRFWSYTRWYGERFNDVVRQHVADVLTEAGYLAVAPALQPYFKMAANEKGPFSNWSERHMAYAAGQGTFSLSDGFISERGIAHRCGSVVAGLELPASPRTAETPFSNCLFYADGSCQACIARCPAGSISEQGHDKTKCFTYRRSNYAYLLERYGFTNVGCGLCQTKVPCEFHNPATNKF